MTFARNILKATPLVVAASVACSTAGFAGTVFSVAGSAPGDIETTVNDFRDELGALNPFTPENFDDGRRQINWDAAPDAISDPNDFPPDFFNGDAAPRARGIEFKGNDQNGNGAKGFQLSSTAASGEPIEFGFDAAFQTFSPERLFAPLGGTEFDVLFFDPFDQTTAAVTDGFGAVFTNVTDNAYVYMSFFDAADNLLAKEFVAESDPGGLSFLGLAFEDSILAKVTISAGQYAIDSQYATASNLVVMDDFIFGEPTVAAVPVPASFLLLLSALAPFGIRKARTFKAKLV